MPSLRRHVKGFGFEDAPPILSTRAIVFQLVGTVKLTDKETREFPEMSELGSELRDYIGKVRVT